MFASVQELMILLTSGLPRFAIEIDKYGYFIQAADSVDTKIVGCSVCIVRTKNTYRRLAIHDLKYFRLSVQTVGSSNFSFLSHLLFFSASFSVYTFLIALHPHHLSTDSLPLDRIL